MKKTFITALVAVATVLAISCSKEEKTISLPGTSWVYNLETTVMGQTLIVNDTLNILDDQNIDRGMSFVAGSNERALHDSFTYTWNGKTLTMLDSVGEPTSMIFNYNEKDNIFYRDMSIADDEMVSIFQMIGITEMPYRQIK